MQGCAFGRDRGKTLPAALGRSRITPRLPGEPSNDRLVELLGLARKVLILSYQLGEAVAAGGKPHRKLVDGGGCRRLRAVLDDVEGLIDRLLGGHHLELLRIEKHGKRDTQLRASARNHPLHQRHRVGGAAFGLVKRGEIVDGRRGVGMIGADGGFADRERALEQRLGVGKAVLALIEVGEIVQRARHVGMAGAKHLFADRKRALDRGLGVVVALLHLLDLAQIVQERRNRGAFGTCRLLVERQRAPGQRL